MSGKAVTPPKGRATRSRNEATGSRSIMGASLQWILVIVAALVIMAGIFYFGRDVRSDLGGSGVVPTDAPVVAADAAVV